MTTTQTRASFQIEKRGRKWKVKGIAAQTRRQFTLSCDAGTWSVTGKTWNGLRRRVKLVAADRDAAVQAAFDALYGDEPIATGGGAGSDEADGDGRAGEQLSIARAFVDAITSTAGVVHRKEQAKLGRYFCDWASARGLALWEDVQYRHVLAYMNELIDRGLKRATVRHYVEPIRTAARFAARNWPDRFHDVTAALRMPAHRFHTATFDEGRGQPVLTFAQALEFLEFLARGGSDGRRGRELLVPATLQALCGLQLQVAVRLLWEDVDLDEGTITIQGVVKNVYRVRRIPLPHIVLETMRVAGKASGRAGTIARGMKWNWYRAQLRRELLAWDPRCEIAPKDLRKTLTTHAMRHAVEEGWNLLLVDRYVGHAPKTISERHYFGDRPKDLMAMWREQLLPRIDAAIAAALASNAANARSLTLSPAASDALLANGEKMAPAPASHVDQAPRASDPQRLVAA